MSPQSGRRQSFVCYLLQSDFLLRLFFSPEGDVDDVFLVNVG
jgi:hypothetical protein